MGAEVGRVCGYNAEAGRRFRGFQNFFEKIFEPSLAGRKGRASEGLGAVDGKHDGIERGGAADIETVPLRAAEDHVGHDLGHLDLPDEGFVRIVAMDAVAGAGPDAATGSTATPRTARSWARS